MNKICVFAKNKQTYFIKRLIEEVGEVALFDPWSDFMLPEAETYLVRTTGVQRNELDLLMLKSLPDEKIFNRLNVLKLFRSKASQYDWFDQNDIPALPWICLKGVDLINVERFFRLHPEGVVKPLNGQGGWGVEVMTWDKFRSWKKKKGSDEDYVLQPLVRSAREYRYFFMKNEMPVILERKAVSGIAANFQKEGDAVLATLPSSVESVLIDLAEKSGAHYGAVDFFVRDNEVIILELNSVPGIEQLEKVSGKNIMKQLLQVLSVNP